MVRRNSKRAVRLNAVQEAGPAKVRGDAIEHEIADKVRRVVQAAIAGKIGDLIIRERCGLLEGQHAKVVLFKLLLIELRGVE